MNLADLPSGDLERLAHYQRARAMEEERELIAGIRLKMDAGVELTDAEWAAYAYSPYGSG